jgi:hypothetical protein
MNANKKQEKSNKKRGKSRKKQKKAGIAKTQHFVVA